MGKRPVTFAQALAQVRKREAPPPSLGDLEEQFFSLLEREVEKLRPASMRVAKRGGTFSAARIDALKQAVAVLDEIDHAGGSMDTADVITKVVKATALVIEATEDETMSPTVTNLRKRAADTLTQIAERLRLPGMTHAEAVTKALDTPEGAAAYEQHDAGRQRGEAPPEFASAPVAKVDSPAWDRICLLANELVQKSVEPMTAEAARHQVIERYPELYDMYVHERERAHGR